MKSANLTSSVDPKSDSELTHNKITTTVEETTTTTTTYDNTDESGDKKEKTDNENTAKLEFDVSARKYVDWIDSIERILSEKPSNTDERKNIIQVCSIGNHPIHFDQLIFEGGENEICVL